MRAGFVPPSAVALFLPANLRQPRQTNIPQRKHQPPENNPLVLEHPFSFLHLFLADPRALAWSTHHWPQRFYRPQLKSGRLPASASCNTMTNVVSKNRSTTPYGQHGTCCMLPPQTESDIWLAYSFAMFFLSFSALHPVVLLTDCKSGACSLLYSCSVCNHGIARPHCHLYPLFGAGRFLIQLLNSSHLCRPT